MSDESGDCHIVGTIYGPCYTARASTDAGEYDSWDPYQDGPKVVEYVPAMLAKAGKTSTVAIRMYLRRSLGSMLVTAGLELPKQKGDDNDDDIRGIDVVGGRGCFCTSGEKHGKREDVFIACRDDYIREG